MKNKKVVVTGGLGFIGSHLIERLNQNNEVIIVDNQSSGNIKNIEGLDFIKDRHRLWGYNRNKFGKNI